MASCAAMECPPAADHLEQLERDSGVRPLASAMVRPEICSVRDDAQAMAVVQPRQRKRTSTNMTIHDTRGKFQNVAANRIARLPSYGRTGQFTGVARIAEVIENGFAEHL